ncbi:MAG TPA: hypothetical protein VIB49_05840 [Thermoplasmata archaeon]|jgi:predicted membrane protein (TIGR00267 family)
MDLSELFRRYFVNTLFDSTFVILGVLAAAVFSGDLGVDATLDIIFAACLAIGISTGVSVYEAEHTEGELRLRRLERALLSPLKDTDVNRRLRTARYATAFVNFLAPLVVAVLMGTPLMLYEAGVIHDFTVAAWVSSIFGLAIIFGAGYYLGSLSGRRPWIKALRMSVVAVLTFLALVFLEQVT